MGMETVLLQYDFVELLDGSRLIAKEHRTAVEPDYPVAVHQAGFIQHLDSGVWHLAFYNDGRNVEAVSYNTIVQGEWDVGGRLMGMLGGRWFIFS